MRTILPTETRPAFRMGLLALMAATVLGGCSSNGGGLRESLGLSAPPPDPFLTVARAPLQMPPSLGALPPPTPGAPSRVEPNPVADARLALGGGFGAVAAGQPSEGEAALLAASGAASADPAIRQQVVAERREPERRFGLDSFLGVPIVQDPALEAERLDAEAEAARLRREGVAAPVPPAQPGADG